MAASQIDLRVAERKPAVAAIFVAAAASLVAGMVALRGAPGLLLAPVVPLVAWSRLRLKRHTLSQIVAGAAIATLFFGPLLAASL